VTTTSADARLNVNGHVQGTGATITTGGSRPRLNGSGVQPDNPPSWVCEAAFGSGGASTVTQKKNWCLAETARWGITPLSGCSDE
jgi:hypothetical protein